MTTTQTIMPSLFDGVCTEALFMEQLKVQRKVPRVCWMGDGQTQGEGRTK